MNSNFNSKKTNGNSTMRILMFSFFLTIIICSGNRSFAQNVGINGTGVAPNNSAMLDVSSSNKGILIPQVALTGATDATTITTGNVNSLLVYNTATAGAGSTAIVPGYYYWNSTAGRWYQMMPGTGSGNVVFAGFQVFTASGTFTIPSGVTKVMIEMWGGGGGGGGSKTGATGSPGSGGGGGAYNKSLFTVSSNITVTIGAGGAGGAGGATGGNGTAGGATSVSGGAVMSAGGGGAGKGNDATGTLGTGGVATATSASVLGINGYQGGAQIGGGTGGPGGPAPQGGAGGQPNGTPGYAGSVPGGGGAGASQDGALTGYAGGAGAAGMVIIWW